MNLNFRLLKNSGLSVLYTTVGEQHIQAKMKPWMAYIEFWRGYNDVTDAYLGSIPGEHSHDDQRQKLEMVNNEFHFLFSTIS